MATQTRTDAFVKFRKDQYGAPRVRGTMWRNKYYFDLLCGTLERGTRAKNRGPYPS